MNQVCSLHTESWVALKRGVGRPGGKGTRGKSWLAPRFQQGHCFGVGETGEGLERSTSEEEGGQGCCQKTTGGDESWGLPGFAEAPLGQNQRLGRSWE